MLKISQKIFLFSLSLILLLNSALAILPVSESNAENPIQELFQPVSPTYMKDTLGNISKLIDTFVFSDILKHPPSPYTDNQVDVTKLFDNIDIANERPFYEFYREVKLALSNLIDANFDITGGKVPLGNKIINFNEYRMCLPFRFYVDYDVNNETNLYIKEYPPCSKYYNSSVREYITKHKDKPLCQINETDPFDFLQNFGTDIYKFKNPDAHFNLIIENIHDNQLGFAPLSLDQLNYIKIDFNESDCESETENDCEPLETYFHIIKAGEESIETNTYAFDDVNDEIHWNIITPNGELKCRLDEENNLNVVFFNSFFFENNGNPTIYQCIKLFRSGNKNKTVIITRQLWEGENIYSYLYTQLLFPKINVRYNAAMKQTEMNKQFYENAKNQFLDSKTCFAFESWESFKKPEPDVYGEVKHERTKSFYPITDLQAVANFQDVAEYSMEQGYNQKPTEILVLTDSVNFGAGSLFIKTIQSYGGGIIASYAGNPKLNKSAINTLDASLDPVFSSKFEDTEEYKSLKKNGFEVYNVPYAELFENIEGDEYPMAFVVNKVDEETNIYHSYEDAYYNEFIGEAKKIFEKYAEQCNKENPNLVYESNCTFADDKYAHGGYPCSSEGKWNVSTCKKFYCDKGYYFDKKEQKCLVDMCTNNPEIIKLNDTYNRTITIKKGENTRYIFKTDVYENIIYIFQANVPGFLHYEIDNPCPSLICALQRSTGDHMGRVFINFFQNVANEDVVINITTITPKEFTGNIYSFLSPTDIEHDWSSNPGKIIFISEASIPNIVYLQAFEASTRTYYAEYSKDMKVSDIININRDYFKIYEDKVFQPEVGKTYIYVASTEMPGSLCFFAIQPIQIEKEINMKNYEILYLSNDTERYILDFIDNTDNKMIQLPKVSFNSEITITNLQTQEKAILNSTNAYYSVVGENSTIFNGKLSIEVTKGNGAVIKLLSAPKDFEIIDESEFTDHKINKTVVIKFDKNNQDKYINIEIKAKESTEFIYHFLTYYSKNDYSPLLLTLYTELEFNGTNSSFEIYNKPSKLEVNESFSLIIYLDEKIFKNNEITISKKESRNPIPELYREVTTEYMNEVKKDILTLFNSFVYSDIIKNPPEPYKNYKKDVIAEIEKINTESNRPFYEFYRDIKTTYSLFRDANLDIIGEYVPLGIQEINMIDYAYCLPFEFYVDKDNSTGEIKIFFKENSICTEYYDDSVLEYIKENENKPVDKINDKAPFEYLQSFGTEYYKFKNPNAHFNLLLKGISYNELSWTPLSIEELNSFKLEANNKPLETHFHIIKIPSEVKEEEAESETDESDITWNITSAGGLLKCREDKENNVNVILINSMYLENGEETTLYKCAKLIHSNDFKVVIITNQLWEDISQNSYPFTQLLFPKIDIKLNMAMKQTELNKKLFEEDKSQFLDPQTCTNYDTWDDFVEPTPDLYDDVKHNRTKIFHPITKEKMYELTEQRKELLKLGHNKKSTDVLILTDTVNFGSASNFIKSIQINGGAIVASYAGNPYLSSNTIQDASLDPMYGTSYVNSDEFQRLREKGFYVYNIPYAEMFKNVKNNDYPLAFVVNKVDEETKIYHSYEDTYYKEFIEEANKIFKKYEEQCNKENPNLVFETDHTFEDDKYAHGGYICGNDGKWDKNNFKKSYCDMGYFYDQRENKCLFDTCSNIEKYPLGELYQEVTPEYMKEVINNSLAILDSYVFSDIMQNPPSPYSEDKVNITAEFEKIVTNKSRPFYEFYRDFKHVVSLFRDSRLEILGNDIPLGNEKVIFRDYYMCLPFMFYLDYETPDDVKMYIKEYPSCSKYFDESVRKDINNNTNNSLSKINGEDPIDFIQNYALYFYNFKNPSSMFTDLLDCVYDNSLSYQPYLPDLLNNITLTFSNGERLETNFHVYLIDRLAKETDNEDKVSESTDVNITWKFSSENGEVKCRIDDEKHLNVLFFNQFYIEPTGNSTIYECAKLFYSNGNKIVIISSLLWRYEDIKNMYYYAQILFPKIDIKFNLAMKQTEYNQQLFNSELGPFINSNTCMAYRTWEEFIESTPDEYEEVKHFRTKTFNPIPESNIRKLTEIRKELIKLGNNKKPTDILLLTDTVAYNAASAFMKTIHNHGGAIFASYAGNPHKTKDERKKLDTSVDPSFTTNYMNTKEYKNLEEKGFEIVYIPYAETFENVKGDNYSMAFIVNEVDEVTDIYHFYEDAYYDEFIKEAKNILDKYGDNKTCIRNNNNLVYEANCTFENDENAYGGYPCGDNGEWDNSTCKKSYCEIEYYYDKILDKCIPDYCISNPDIVDIPLTGEYDKTITIDKENNTQYVLRVETDEYLYLFEASAAGFMHYEFNNPCPSYICALQKGMNNHDNKLYLNYFKNVTNEDVEIKITSVKNFPGLIQSLVETTFEHQAVYTNPGKLILFAETTVDYINYFRTFDSSSKIFCAEYTKEMKIQDILDISKTIFTTDITNKLVDSQPGKMYIFAAETQTKDSPIQIAIQPKKGKTEFAIQNSDIYIMYFDKDIEYTLDFTKNDMDRMIQLSKATPEGEITIKNIKTTKEVTLNSTNPYYSFDNVNSIFKDKLSIKAKGNGAAIEFLYSPADSGFEVLGDKDYTDKEIGKSAVISFEKNTQDKNVNITIRSKSGNVFGYSYLQVYSKDNYISYPNNFGITYNNQNTYLLTINNKKENLVNGESLNLVLYFEQEMFKNDKIIISKIEEKSEEPSDTTPTDGSSEEDEGLPVWAIVLIVIGSVLVLVAIFIVIWKCVLSKGHVDSDAIGSLITQSGSNELNEKNT